MTDDKTLLTSPIELCSNLVLIRYKINTIWRDVINDYRMLWPIATFTERLKLLGFAPISMIRTNWWTIMGAGWLLVGNLTLKVMLSSAKSGPAAEAYGIELAQAVADKLIEDKKSMPGDYGAGLTFHHKYYCGQGLFFGWSTLTGFRLCHSEDGYPNTTVLKFDTCAAFVDWLSVQSDLSLSGVSSPLKDWGNVGNQRITRDRLEQFMQVSADG